MKDYKYTIIAIPTINGEIYGNPKIWFTNIKKDDYLELLDFFDFIECVIYRINNKSLSIEEVNRLCLRLQKLLWFSL